jgi:hypothetical protein
LVSSREVIHPRFVTFYEVPPQEHQDLGVLLFGDRLFVDRSFLLEQRDEEGIACVLTGLSPPDVRQGGQRAWGRLLQELRKLDAIELVSTRFELSNNVLDAVGDLIESQPNQARSILESMQRSCTPEAFDVLLKMDQVAWRKPPHTL